MAIWHGWRPTAVTLRHGNLVAHVHHIHDLEAAVVALANASSQGSGLYGPLPNQSALESNGVLATAAKLALNGLSASPGQSLHQAVAAGRQSLNPASKKWLEQLNGANAFLKHNSDVAILHNCSRIVSEFAISNASIFDAKSLTTVPCGWARGVFAPRFLPSRPPGIFEVCPCGVLVASCNDGVLDGLDDTWYFGVPNGDRARGPFGFSGWLCLGWP